MPVPGLKGSLKENCEHAIQIHMGIEVSKSKLPLWNVAIYSWLAHVEYPVAL